MRCAAVKYKQVFELNFKLKEIEDAQNTSRDKLSWCRENLCEPFAIYKTFEVSSLKPHVLNVSL